jgi:hypothetical protein
LEELWRTWIVLWMKVECEYCYLTYCSGLKHMQCTFQTTQIVLYNSHRIYHLVKLLLCGGSIATICHTHDFNKPCPFTKIQTECCLFTCSFDHVNWAVCTAWRFCSTT